MLERGPQDGVAVAAAAGRAREVDDERAPGDPGGPAREQPVRRLRDRVGAEGLGDAGRLTVEHVAGRLRRDVAWGEPGAARREDQPRGRRELAQRFGDLLPLVRDDAPLDLVPVARQQLRQQVAAPVLGLAARDAVADRQDGSLQTVSFVFSTSETSPIVIALSIAFAMS
jgi:hypothetical protein